MEAVVIVERSVLEKLISEIGEMKSQVREIAKERNDLAKPLMTVKEVCEFLGKGSTWLDANKEKIGFTRAGGELRFRRKDVEAYLEEGYFRRPTSGHKKSR